MNSEYSPWKWTVFIPSDIWPFNLVYEFLENSMLHTNQENYFMYNVCSFRRIGCFSSKKKVDKLRVSHHFKNRKALWIHSLWPTSNRTHLSSFTAVSRDSIDINVLLYSTASTVIKDTRNSRLSRAMYTKNASIRRCNYIACIMRGATSFVFAAYSI